MSIQASWNRMVGSAAALTGLARLGKGLNKPAEPNYGQMSPEELAAAHTEATNPKMDEAINGIETRLTEKYGLSPEAARQLTDDIRAGRGEGWTSRFDEARAMAQRARDAAEAENTKPTNVITTAEEAVRHLQEIQRQEQGGAK